MRTRLLELGLAARLTWPEVADIQADHEAALVAAVDQALGNHVRFSVDARQAHHFAVCLELLRTVPFNTGTYESRAPFTTFEKRPEPVFTSTTEDVDPADVPDLPGLDAVADAPSVIRARRVA